MKAMGWLVAVTIIISARSTRENTRETVEVDVDGNVFQTHPPMLQRLKPKTNTSSKLAATLGAVLSPNNATSAIKSANEVAREAASKVASASKDAVLLAEGPIKKAQEFIEKSEVELLDCFVVEGASSLKEVVPRIRSEMKNPDANPADLYKTLALADLDPREKGKQNLPVIFGKLKGYLENPVLKPLVTDMIKKPPIEPRIRTLKEAMRKQPCKGGEASVDTWVRELKKKSESKSTAMLELSSEILKPSSVARGEKKKNQDTTGDVAKGEKTKNQDTTEDVAKGEKKKNQDTTEEDVQLFFDLLELFTMPGFYHQPEMAEAAVQIDPSMLGGLDPTMLLDPTAIPVLLLDMVTSGLFDILWFILSCLNPFTVLQFIGEAAISALTD